MINILLLALFSVVLVLVAGIVLMARGGKLNEKYGNKLMILRVVLQLAAVILVVVIFVLQ